MKRLVLIGVIVAGCSALVPVRTATPTFAIGDDKLLWCARSPLTLINVANRLGLDGALTDAVFKEFAGIAVGGSSLDHDPSSSLRANPDVVRICTVAYETVQ